MRVLLWLLVTLLEARSREARSDTVAPQPFDWGESTDDVGNNFHIFRVHDEHIFEALKKAYKNEKDVIVERGESLVYLHPLMKDRSCLLPPPVPPRRVESRISSAIHSVEDALEWANRLCGKERALDGSLSTFGHVIEQNMHHSKLYAPSTETRCEKVSSHEMEKRFKTEYWVKQRPVIITDYFQPPGSADLLKNLHEAADEIVGVKLSDSEDFEGVEPLSMWAHTAKGDVYDIPKAVREQLLSEELVVVRAAHKQISLGETLDLLLNRENGSSTRAYVEYHRLRESGAVMRSLAPPLPPWLQELLPVEEKGRGEPYLWLGDGRTVGKVHFDPYDNVMAVLEGAKSFRLIPTGRLSEGHLREAELEASWDQVAEDYQVYRGQLSESTSLVHSLTPNLDHEQHALDCKVSAGEALFVPSYWWHEVRSEPSSVDLNVAINYWFPPLYTKEFPCTECVKAFNHRVYRDSAEAYFDLAEGGLSAERTGTGGQ